VYGDPLETPQKESYWGNVNPVGIRSCYDEGKRAAETLTMDYQRQYGLDIRIVRIFNTYGPRMSSSDGRVVSNFIVQAIAGAPLTIYGDGKQTRSFCYVDDLIEGFLAVFNADTSSPVNLGNPEPISILDLAEEIIEMVGSNSKLDFLEEPSDDPKTREPDISLAREILDWSPKISRREGISRTINYFKRLA
jgi:UDP-glucuronate decarboxylase